MTGLKSPRHKVRCNIYDLHFSAEVSKSVGDGPGFLRFCPDWKEALLFKEWQKYVKKCYRGGMDCITLNLCWSD
jgi:hypothetical protein